MTSYVLLNCLLFVIIYGVSECALYNRKFAEGMKLDWYSQKSWYRAKICAKEKEFFRRLSNFKKATYRPKGQRFVRSNLPLPSKRREYRCLSRNELRGFHKAINLMKVNKISNESKYTEYDNLVIIHDSQNAPAAHWGPAFLTWHREFILSLERGLQKYCPSCMLPYWDNRLDSRLRDLHSGSILFSEFLAGNAEGPVTTGFAANWKQIGEFCQNVTGKMILRTISDGAGTLFSENDVEYYLVPQYKQIVFPWNSLLEELHGSVHMYFGRRSTMAVTSCSPNDPFFFLHHSFIDLLFEKHRNYTLHMKHKLKYPDIINDIPSQVEDIDALLLHEGGRTKLPFTTTNAEGLLNDDYTKIYYRYQKPPGDVVGCTKDAHCCGGSITPDFLWCNAETGQCLSKLREGARTSPAFPDNACYCEASKRPANVDSYCACID